jgi:hypothetical protein
MENALEQEQEMIVNRLQRKLQRLQQPLPYPQSLGSDSRCESSSDEISNLSSNDASQKYVELKKQYESQQAFIGHLRMQIGELTRRIEQLHFDNLKLSNASGDLVSVDSIQVWISLLWNIRSSHPSHSYHSIRSSFFFRQSLGSGGEEGAMFDSLLKKISNLQKDKEQLILEVEQEEEYLTNTLQQRLERVSMPGHSFPLFFLVHIMRLFPMYRSLKRKWK